MSAAAVPFEKWEGLGNDFVILEGVAMTAEAARRLCDRRRGVGGDGVLVVERAPARMQVWNADGSRPEMCGNGLRCVAAYLVARGAAGATLSVETDAGAKRCEVEAAGAGWEVLVDMGRARFGEPLVVAALGGEHRFATVDLGNPHAVTFEPYAEDVIDRLGPAVATAPASGVNVEFCRARGDAGGAARIEVTVWERGVGRTLACGTGACAAAAAACETGRAAFGAPIRVALPGGELAVTVARGTRQIAMRGPARKVFSGEVGFGAEGAVRRPGAPNVKPVIA